MTSIRLLPVMLLCSFLVGCATTPEPKGTSGFLSQYKNLQPLAGGEKEVFAGYRANRLKLRKYDKILVNPVVLHLRPETIEAWQIQSERYKKLQTYFTNQLNYRMGQHYELASEPGEGTLRLRVAITGAELDAKPLEVYQVLPWALVINGVGELTGVRDKMLNIYEEGELVDSVTGEQVAALVGGVQVGPIDVGDLKEQSVEDFKPLIDAWVDAFCRNLPK